MGTSRRLSGAYTWLAVLLGSVASAGSQPISVAVGEARIAGETVNGVVIAELPVILHALGAETTYSKADGCLKAALPGGPELVARAGASEMTVGGATRKVRTPFEARETGLRGPVEDVAKALGAATTLDEEHAELRIAHRLARVDAVGADEACVLHISTSGPTQGSLVMLDEPRRAYVDFIGLTWLGASESLEMGGTGGLQRVRWALNQERPPVTRVVADLEEGADATLLQVGDNLFRLTILPGHRTGPAVQPTPAPAWRADWSGVHVVIDPAAGGSDPGLRGPSISEKSVALDIAIRLSVMLANLGAEVTMTRDGDVTRSLVERAQVVKGAEDADIVLRIGCGLGDGDESGGIATQYSRGTAAELATSLHAALLSETNANDLGQTEAPEAALPETDVPLSVTCLVGQLSSTDDDRRLATHAYRERIASALKVGIEAYLDRN